MPDGLGTPQCQAACDQETAAGTKPHPTCALGPSPHSELLLGARHKNEGAVAFGDNEPDSRPPTSLRKRPELIRQVVLHGRLTERETEAPAERASLAHWKCSGIIHSCPTAGSATQIILLS